MVKASIQKIYILIISKMKNAIKKTFIVSLFFITISAQGSLTPVLPRTPKAADLENHFGTLPSTNQFGPQSNVILDIAREYDNVDKNNGVTPIKNLQQEINPLEVVHGDLSNTAYDASQIIKPEIAAPKAKVDATFLHEAVINTPVHLAQHKTTTEIATFNRLTGEVSTKKVESEIPVIGVLKNLRQVETKQTTYINLNDGKIINTNPVSTYHGTN